MRLISKFIACSALTGWLCLRAISAKAAIDPALLKPLAGDDPDARIAAVTQIAALANADAQKILDAINNDALYATPAGDVLIVSDTDAFNPATDKTGPVPDDADAITVNNRLRGVVEGALSGLKLFSDDRNARLSAATALLTTADAAQTPLISKALAAEKDPEIQAVLKQVVATANLHAPDAQSRRAAVKALADTTNANLRPVLQQMLSKNPDGSDVEPDEGVRIEAVRTLSALDRHLAMTDFVGKLFYGVSLGSVLLLAALGLAITFGLMGIINMAHGELLMIGAYTTYVCQLFFRVRSMPIWWWHCLLPSWLQRRSESCWSGW